MSDRRGAIAGIVFILVGLAFLLDELDVLEMSVAYLLPILLIALGVWVLLGRSSIGSRRR